MKRESQASEENRVALSPAEAEAAEESDVVLIDTRSLDRKCLPRPYIGTLMSV